MSSSVPRPRARKNRDHVVVETAMDGVILVDSHGVIRMINPAGERLFGYRRGEAVDRNVAALIPAFGEQKPGQISEIHGIRKDGSSFPIELSLGRSAPDGEPILVGIVRELTATKYTQPQLVEAQRMGALEHISGDMAHDFNNLLTVIIGSLDMLQSELRSHPKAREIAELALRGSAKAAELTRQLLAFSRRQTLEPKIVSLNELVSGAAQVASRTPNDPIRIKLLLADNLWPMLADPAQVESALLNLTTNARDAMPEGGDLTIETANRTLDERYCKDNPEAAPGDYVMLAVSDTGIGMPPNVLEHAFDPFFTTKARRKCTGLGLSTVYGFARQSGGHVKISSEVGQGTTVCVYLPRAEAESEAESSGSEQM